MATPRFDSAPLHRERWWCERELLVLIALVGGIYFTRIEFLPVRGEETRRARIACEMLESGDWLIAQQQGQPFTSRPPLANWPIAWSIAALGDCSPLAARLPSIIATLLTTLLIYGYARQFTERVGALSAAAAYATMGQVLQLGQVAETEAMFTLLLAAALLIWHWNFAARQAPLTAWLLGYSLAALATLAKGPQAPVYFCASVGAYLIVTRRWRELLTARHFGGCTLFLAIVGAWQIPFFLRLGWPAVHDVWAGDVAMRFEDRTWKTWFLHLLEYPLEVAACLAPWSLLLPLLMLGEVRRQFGRAQPAVLFAVISIAVTFPTCWLVQGARGRYYMPLFPSFAVLVGAVIQSIYQLTAAERLLKAWRAFLKLAAVVALGLAAAVLVASLRPQSALSLLAQPIWFAVLYSAAAMVAAVALTRFPPTAQVARLPLAVLVLAVLLGITHTGVVLNAMAARSERAGDVVHDLKTQLPTDVRLVSFGPIENMFAFHYKQAIPLLAWPREAHDLPPDVSYFCFNHEGDTPPVLPFAWRQIGVVSCDRNHYEKPIKSVIVGQRIETAGVGTRRQ